MPKFKGWYGAAVAVVLLATVLAFRFTGLAVLATDEEHNLALPGDRLMPSPAAMLTHGITIDAPTRCVWPWLVQMGSGRAGWYSYDWVDNDGVPSATTIMPAMQRVQQGDVFPSLPGVKTSFIVGAVEPGRDLVLTVRAPQGGLMVVWEFHLVPAEKKQTRLLMRGRVAQGWPGRGSANPGRRPIEIVYWTLARIPTWVMIPAAELGHGVMAASQLRHIKHRVEASGCSAD